MTEREALKLALEAMERFGEEGTAERYIKAKAAIKEALAQPEQEPVADPEKHPQFYTWTWDVMVSGAKWRAEYGWKKPEGYVFANLQALYTEPIQRTWVGLTDDEIDQGLLRSDYAFKTAEAWRAGVVFAMTKLKEKNT